MRWKWVALGSAVAVVGAVALFGAVVWSRVQRGELVQFGDRFALFEPVDDVHVAHSRGVQTVDGRATQTFELEPDFVFWTAWDTDGDGKVDCAEHWCREAWMPGGCVSRREGWRWVPEVAPPGGCGGPDTSGSRLGMGCCD